MSVMVDPPAEPLSTGLDAARAALGDAAQARVWHLPDAAVLAGLEAAYAAVAQAQAVWLRLVAETDRRELATAVGATGTAALLRGRLLVRPEEAAAAVRLARALHGRCPATGAALAGGEISVEQARVITRAVAALPEQAGAEVAAQAEAVLLEQAGTFDPKTLGVLGGRILEVVDPDAADAKLADELAREERRAARRREFRLREDGEGTTWLSGRLDAEAAAIVRAALDPLAAPRPSAADGPDRRSAAQRHGDALVELCRRALVGGDLPDNGGERPQLVLTIDFDRLRDQLGAALLDTGTPLSPATARRLACDAKILPAVLGSAGQLLDLGTARRLFTGPIRRALVLRDRGCAFPGCDRPPAWTEGHHIRSVIDGGPTSLNNGVLLCGHHHTVIHHREWDVFIDPADGLPTFLPPAWLDPDRKPLRNTLHRRP